MSFTDQHHWIEERLSGTKKLSVSWSFTLCFGSVLMSVMDYKALAACRLCKSNNELVVIAKDVPEHWVQAFNEC